MPAAARNMDRREKLLLLIADMLTSLSRLRLRLHGFSAPGCYVARIALWCGDVNLRLRLRQGVGRSLFEALNPVRNPEHGGGAGGEGRRVRVWPAALGAGD